MKRLQQRVLEFIMFALWVFCWISFVCLFSAFATDNSLGEIKQMLSDWNNVQINELNNELLNKIYQRVDDVDNRVLWFGSDIQGWIFELQSRIPYTDYDERMKKCEKILAED